MKRFKQTNKYLIKIQHSLFKSKEKNISKNLKVINKIYLEICFFLFIGQEFQNASSSPHHFRKGDPYPTTIEVVVDYCGY